MNALTDKRCIPCSGEVPRLDLAAAVRLREQLDARWRLARDGNELVARFSFSSYQQLIAFVNAVAFIAIAEDHHPEVSFGYNQCSIRYWTHAIDGLSENDFICAAKIDAMLALAGAQRVSRSADAAV